MTNYTEQQLRVKIALLEQGLKEAYYIGWSDCNAIGYDSVNNDTCRAAISTVLDEIDEALSRIK